MKTSNAAQLYQLPTCYMLCNMMSVFSAWLRAAVKQRSGLDLLLLQISSSVVNVLPGEFMWSESYSCFCGWAEKWMRKKKSVKCPFYEWKYCFEIQRKKRNHTHLYIFSTESVSCIYCWKTSLVESSGWAITKWLQVKMAFYDTCTVYANLNCDRDRLCWYILLSQHGRFVQTKLFCVWV